MIDNVIALAPIPSRKWLNHYKVHPASPSSVGTAGTCARMFDGKYMGIHVEKVKSSYNKGADEGGQVHISLEDYLIKGTPIPEKWLEILPNLQAKADWVKDHKGFTPDSVELRMSHDSSGVCDWNKRTMGAIADVVIDESPEHRIILDWKTNKATDAKGKYRSPYPKPLQLEMMAIMSFIENPKLEKVTGIFEFLRHDKRYTYEYCRDKVYVTVTNGRGTVTEKPYLYPVELMRYWNMQMTGKYYPRKNPLCKEWCDVKCEHNGKFADQITIEDSRDIEIVTGAGDTTPLDL